MTQSLIRARYGLGIWGFVSAGFGMVFFLGGGAVTYADDSIRMGIAAVILGIGFVGYLSMIYLTREKSNGRTLISDERDLEIARQANEIALVAVLVFVFSVCIALFLLQPKSTVHIRGDFAQSSGVTTTDFRCDPTGEVNIGERLSDISPDNIPCANLGELVRLARESLDVQFHNSFAERPDPRRRVAILPVVADIVLHPDPRRIELVNILDELIGRLVGRTAMVIEKMVPDNLSGEWFVVSCQER